MPVPKAMTADDRPEREQIARLMHDVIWDKMRHELPGMTCGYLADAVLALLDRYGEQVRWACADVCDTAESGPIGETCRECADAIRHMELPPLRRDGFPPTTELQGPVGDPSLDDGLDGEL